MATRYRRDKQKLQIESQTIQWPQDTDEINRSYKSKVRHYNSHKIEEINRSYKSKVRHYNGHKIPTRSTEATNRRSDNTMATRYRGDKQKQQIEGQTIQWPQDTDEKNRSYKSKVRQYNGHKIEEINRSYKSKVRQCNGHKIPTR